MAQRINFPVLEVSFQLHERDEDYAIPEKKGKNFTKVVLKKYDDDGDLEETKEIFFEEHQNQQLLDFLSDVEMVFDEADLNAIG